MDPSNEFLSRWKEVSRDDEREALFSHFLNCFLDNPHPISNYVIAWKSYNLNIENRTNYFHLSPSWDNHREIFSKLLIILM